MKKFMWMTAVLGLMVMTLANQSVADKSTSNSNTIKKGKEMNKPVVPSSFSKVKIVTDRDSALYTCKDKAVFTVTVTDWKKRVEKGICVVKLSNDGGKLIAEKKFDLAVSNPFHIEAQLDHPGFVRCDFMGVDKFRNVQGRAAAGFDVEKIRQGVPEPKDFDQYWQGLLQRQAGIKNAVTCEPIPDNIGRPEYKSGYKYYKITVKTIDNGKVYGFLGIPSESPGPFAANVMISCAGSGYTIPDPTFIRPDMMTLAINIHPIDPMLPQEEFLQKYKELTAKKPYWFQGAPDRDKYYFRNAILGANAAVEFLVNHPQFNRKDLLSLSTSQGGGFSLILAGLNHNFTAVASGVPGLCDHGGVVKGRSGGWPHLVKAVAGKDQKMKKQCLEMSGYFDAVNFAKRVECPVIFSVGFLDTTCCPSSVYAAYNAVKPTKYIMTAPLEGHCVPWEHINGLWQWLQNGFDEKYRNYNKAYFKW